MKERVVAEHVAAVARQRGAERRPVLGCDRSGGRLVEPQAACVELIEAEPGGDHRRDRDGREIERCAHAAARTTLSGAR